MTLEQKFKPVLQHFYDEGYIYMARQGKESLAEFSLSIYTEEPYLVEKYDFWDYSGDKEMVIPYVLFKEVTFESGIVKIEDILKEI